MGLVYPKLLCLCGQYVVLKCCKNREPLCQAKAHRTIFHIFSVNANKSVTEKSSSTAYLTVSMNLCLTRSRIPHSSFSRTTEKSSVVAQQVTPVHPPWSTVILWNHRAQRCGSEAGQRHYDVHGSPKKRPPCTNLERQQVGFPIILLNFGGSVKCFLWHMQTTFPSEYS